MNAQSLVASGEFGQLLWRWGVAIVLAIIGTELLPVVFGTGYEATWDWGFTYVTMRFVLLPIFCLAHLVLAAVFLFARRRQQAEVSALPATSALIAMGYLVSLWFYPLPPWWLRGF